MTTVPTPASVPSAGSAALAIVCVPVAPLHVEPRVSSAQSSQRLYGHLVTVLEQQSDWRRVRSADGYDGWAHGGYLRAPLAHETDPARGRVSLGCRIRDGARAWQTRTLPLGAVVAPGVDVLDGEALSRDDLARRFPPTADAVVATATERFAGTSYQWGGVTPWGADCSGLVQTVFGLHGIALPRDAWQQALEGEHVAGEDLAALRPADLVFFSDRDDRRVTHVGISTGGARIVHLALGRGGYAVDRLDDAADPYAAALATRVVGARRLLS